MSMTGIDKFIEDEHLRTGADYIDIVCEFAMKHFIDFEDLKVDLHPNIINKIKDEFIKKNVVKGDKLETSLTDFL